MLWKNGCKAACAFSTVMPGCRRPITLTQRLRRFSRSFHSGVICGFIITGTRTCVALTLLDAVKTLLADADHVHVVAVDDDGFADDLGIPGESRLPISVTENRDGMPALRERCPAALKTRPSAGCDAEHLEVVARNQFALHALGAAVRSSRLIAQIEAAQQAAEDIRAAPGSPCTSDRKARRRPRLLP